MRDKYRAVIFDAGGTLIGQDDPLGFEKELVAVLADLDVSASVEQIRGLMSRMQKEGRKRRKRIGGWSRTPEEDRENLLWVGTFLLENLGVSGDVEGKATAIYDTFVAGGFIDLFSDVKPALEYLTQQRIKMGVLSNYAAFLERNFHILGIHHYFAFFVVSSLVRLEKPDPRIFHMATRKAGYPQEEILYVGDSLHDDVEGAKAAGLDVILVDRFDRSPEADCERIRSLTELLEILE